MERIKLSESKLYLNKSQGGCFIVDYDRRYKIIISILFGMIGFYLNLHSPDIFHLSELGFNVNLLWGLLFPLLISFVWAGDMDFFQLYLVDVNQYDAYGLFY